MDFKARVFPIESWGKTKVCLFNTQAMRIPPEKHNFEIAFNRQVWGRKPLLREIYRKFYQLISLRLRWDLPGVTVELGSGNGNIKEIIPGCVTTDLFPNPWLDRQENAYALTMPDDSVANLILFDVWHHLAHPETALEEFARVVMPGGRILIFEPGLGMLGKFIYGCFHHEPLGFADPIAWKAPAAFKPHDAPYFAAIASATRYFLKAQGTEFLSTWRVVEVNRIVSISYVASGGFSKMQLYPTSWLPIVQRLDELLACLPGLFATRLLVVLERKISSK